VFRLSSGPGSFRIYSWRELNGDSFRNIEFMKHYDDRGVPVKLEKGSSASIDLVILDN
jgi:hypothetical protein